MDSVPHLHHCHEQQPVNMITLIAALAHLAHARAAAAMGVGGVPNTAAYTQLATKLESLIHTCLEPNIMPEIARRVSQLNDLPLSKKVGSKKHNTGKTEGYEGGGDEQQTLETTVPAFVTQNCAVDPSDASPCKGLHVELSMW